MLENECDVVDTRYRWMNPEFVKRVWEKQQSARRERLRKAFEKPVRAPDAIDIMLQRAVEKYGNVKTPRQRRNEDIAAVATVYGLTLKEIMSKQTTHTSVKARSAAMWMLKFSRGWTLPEIGRVFDMDHTGVLAGIKRHTARIDPSDPSAEWIERKRAVARSKCRYVRKTDRPTRRAA